MYQFSVIKKLKQVLVFIQLMFRKYFIEKSKSKRHQVCINVIKDFGFEGDDFLYNKGECYISISDDRIRLWYNYPGFDKDYIGPPLPSKKELVIFLRKNTFYEHK